MATPDEGAAVVVSPQAVASPPSAGCSPTDQDQFVYNPDRLQVVTPCLRVTGSVAAVRNEADGDLHLLLALDPEFASLLTQANNGEELGDLVVEPVCVRSVTQADAVAVCATDPDPLSPLPSTVGARVWMEGRYVLDLEHGGWAELHPLYRWGPYSGTNVTTTAAPPTAVLPPASTLTVQITGLTSPVNRGSQASLSAATTPAASCSIDVEYKSGPSTAAGLEPKTASASGEVSWSWRVGASTTPGSWPVTVTCAIGSESASATADLVVQ